MYDWPILSVCLEQISIASSYNIESRSRRYAIMKDFKVLAKSKCTMYALEAFKDGQAPVKVPLHPTVCSVNLLPDLKTRS